MCVSCVFWFPLALFYAFGVCLCVYSCALCLCRVVSVYNLFLMFMVCVCILFSFICVKTHTFGMILKFIVVWFCF